MTEYKIALLGFGGVNRALAQLIADKNERWAYELGFTLKIVGVSDLYLGSIINKNGLNAKELAAVPATQGAFRTLPTGSAEPANETVIRFSDADLVAEATFTNPVDGEPATTFCRWALEKGISVVTTNKGPVALHAESLKKLAERTGAHFEFEGSVMSGTPVIRLAQELLAGAEITEFKGILNGTSNFVLSSMETGLDFADAVAKAQELGYAEADPTADVEGHDVRLKVVILANEFLGAKLTPSDVSCKGISQITADDIAEATKSKARWKLIGSAKKLQDGSISASVSPQLLPQDDALAGVSGATNAITFSTNILGPVTVSGAGAGRYETAFALLSDIVSIHKKKIKTGK
ncbi:homoserine dehydrogenase [Pseudomonas batumici]|uniref:homoserine dehydrogenase n=1 Tax=Pseudomonas batumici TaxID=226910 RepID=A0A0C2EV20_9PSED|nr:homoserine dehydrogenase [Pseudomonas batumici]KIH82493.1 Homoserine dehydrogenase [Pseudomonas batumici]